jgi:general secretion pathway protein I
MTPEKRISSRSGFTLIEALIAITILSGAMLLLSQTWGGAFRSIKKAKQQYEVALLLERKIAELELEFGNKPLTEIPEEREEDFGKEYPEAKWKMKSKEFEFPDISPLLKSDDGKSDEMTMMIFKKLADNFKKTVKEVKVTVMVKEGKKTKEFSAVTYFVDYDQTLSL